MGFLNHQQYELNTESWSNEWVLPEKVKESCRQCFECLSNPKKLPDGKFLGIGYEGIFQSPWKFEIEKDYLASPFTKNDFKHLQTRRLFPKFCFWCDREILESKPFSSHALFSFSR